MEGGKVCNQLNRRVSRIGNTANRGLDWEHYGRGNKAPLEGFLNPDLT
jgi:hypothetical protein